MEEKKEKKLSYEELNNIATQLSEQNKQLYAKLQEANMINIFKRLDYLFKVISLKDNFKESFVYNCTDEITSLLTLEETKEDAKG